MNTGPVATEIRGILYDHPLMAELRRVRDGELSIVDRTGTDAVMEQIMALEEAITRLAESIDRAARR